MQDPTSGAQVVPPSPETPLPLSSVEPIAQSVVTAEPILDAEPNPSLAPTSFDTITAQPSALPIAETNTPADAAHNRALFPIIPPEIDEPQVAPAVEAPKSVEQPTVTMAENLPTGVAALSERVTLEAPPPGTLPNETDSAQPIEPEIPQTTVEQPQIYKALTSPEPELSEGHGIAPTTTGASTLPLAKPEVVEKLTKAIQASEEEVAAAPLPVQPETAIDTAIPIVPETTLPAEAEIDFGPELKAQAAALRQEPVAMAEKPPAPTLKTGEEDSIEKVAMLKRPESLEGATDMELERVIGSRKTQ